MATVLLSPVGGVAAQFFTNTGAVLTGGKLYTYQAGTTTAEPTYTTSAGTVAHPNPIVLDAAGRVPGGEVWLTNKVTYKFVLKDSNDVLIGTYDNIIGAFNVVNIIPKVGRAVGDGTTVTFALVSSPSYFNTLNVYINGVYQFKNTYYLFTNEVQFTEAPPFNSKIEFNYY
jgi:hypothetical protein